MRPVRSAVVPLSVFSGRVVLSRGVSVDGTSDCPAVAVWSLGTGLPLVARVVPLSSIPITSTRFPRYWSKFASCVPANLYDTPLAAIVGCPLFAASRTTQPLSVDVGALRAVSLFGPVLSGARPRSVCAAAIVNDSSTAVQVAPSFAPAMMSPLERRKPDSAGGTTRSYLWQELRLPKRYWQVSPSTRTEVTRSIGIALVAALALLLRRELALVWLLTGVPVISTRLLEYSFGRVMPDS